MKEKKVKEPKVKKIKVKKIKEKKPKVPHKKLSETFAFKFEVALLVLMVVFFSALIMILRASITRNDIKIYRDFNTTVAAESSTAISYWLNSYYKDLRVFTKANVFLTGDIEEVREYMLGNTQLINVDFDYVGICDNEGHLYTSTGEEVDAQDKDFFNQILTKGADEYISNPSDDSITGRKEFYVAVSAVNENGNVFGVFVGAIPTSIAENEIGRIKLSGEGYVFTLDGSGTIISHPDSDEMGKNYYEMGDETSGLIGYYKVADDMIYARLAICSIHRFLARHGLWVSPSQKQRFVRAQK